MRRGSLPAGMRGCLPRSYSILQSTCSGCCSSSIWRLLQPREFAEKEAGNSRSWRNRCEVDLV